MKAKSIKTVEVKEIGAINLNNIEMQLMESSDTYSNFTCE